MKALWKLTYGLFRFEATPISEAVRNYCVKKLVKSCGKRLVVQRGVMIRGWENIEIGEDVNLNDGVYINGMGKLKIGNGCRIAPNVGIYTETHNIDRRDIPFHKQGWSYSPIIIEDDVWICAGAIITMGVKIGKGAVVGANCVVTKDIGEYEIWGGVPAKFIKMRKGGKNDDV